MKLILRISALTLLVAAAVAGKSLTDTAAVATNIHGSVPGGGGPMPVCNSFQESCSAIR
jgi:hypothetical protein